MDATSFSRPFSVLFAPLKTFTSIAERPSFVVPLLLLVVLGVGSGFLIHPKIDYAETLTEAMSRGGQTPDEEQLGQAVEMMEKYGAFFSLLGVLVFQPVGILVVSLAFWLLFKLFGSEMSFVSSLSVVAHALMPLLVVGLITLLVALGRDSLSGNELQFGLVASNPAAFLAADASEALKFFLRQFDFFSFWVMALFVIGYRAVSGVKGSTVTATVVACWVFWMLGKFGFSMIGSVMGGA